MNHNMTLLIIITATVVCCALVVIASCVIRKLWDNHIIKKLPYEPGDLLYAVNYDGGFTYTIVIRQIIVKRKKIFIISGQDRLYEYGVNCFYSYANAREALEAEKL